MQKRSLGMEICYYPIDLDPALPVLLDENFIQKDRPITSLHVHNCLELGLCHEGQGLFMVGEKILPFEADDVAFINQTEVHLARSAPGSDSRWTWIYLDPVRLVDHPAALAVLDPTPLAGAGFRNILSGKRHPDIARIIRRVIEESKGREGEYRQALKALVWELMILVHRMAPRHKRRSRVFRRDYDRLAPALQMLSRDYAGDKPVGQFARQCRMSEPHFRRLFRQTIGVSPLAYRNDLRMRMAGSLLLNTSRSILEISQDVGFESLSSFNRQFRSCFKTNPSSWKKSRV